MADLNFDFSIDSDISLDKMYTDAKKIGKLNITSTNANINPSYSVEPANAYGGISSSKTETMDLSLDNLTNANKNLQSNNFNLNNNELKVNNNISNNTLNGNNTNTQSISFSSNNVNNMSSSLNNNFQNQTTMGSSSNGMSANVVNQFGNENGGSNVSFTAPQNSNLKANINSNQNIGINGQNNFSGNFNTSSFNSAINSQSSMKNDAFNLGGNLNTYGDSVSSVYLTGSNEGKTAGEIEYDNAEWWEKALMDTATFSVSFAFGIGGVFETIVDGCFMIAGGIDKLFFTGDAQWAEDIVSVNCFDEMYDDLVREGVLNSKSAYSGWHTAGNIAGSVTGYTCLSLLSGNGATMAVVGGLSAMGSSSERALNSGATFGEAFATGALSGVVGFASGATVDKLGKVAIRSTSLLQVGKYTLEGAGASIIEPIVNSEIEYDMYAKDMTDANGAKLYDNRWDYYKESGGLTNTLIAGAAGGFSVGSQGLKGYKNHKSSFDVDKISKNPKYKNFYETANPHKDFEGMKPADQLNEYNRLISSGKTETEVLGEMLDSYEQKYVPDWARSDYRSKLEQGYANLVNAGDRISREDFLKMQLQIVPYDPKVQIPNTYANWEKSIQSSSEMVVFYKSGDLVNLVNGNPGVPNYGNGLGRAAENGYSSALFTLAGSQCQLPDNWSSLSKMEMVEWISETVKLDPKEFKTGCYKIDIDKSLFAEGSMIPSTSQTLGANGAWSATMTPLGSNVFEATPPRIEDVLTIDPSVQSALNRAISASDHRQVMAIFDNGIKNGTILPKKGVTITHLY